MKNLLILLSPFLLLNLSCKQDNIEADQKGELTFALELIQEIDNSRITNNLPAGSSIRLSVQDSEGIPILTNEVIPILKINNDWVTEPISFDVGEYILSEFIVLSPENEILYAIPLKESPLADLVSNPLPLSFEVIANEINNLNLEVLNAINLNAEDIGYVAFPFKLIDYFHLSVFAPNPSGQSFTNAEAYIIQNSDTLKSFDILPEINTLTFTQAASGEFTLVVVKSGFAKYSQEFTINEIFENYENAIITVDLIPALTFTAVPIFFNGNSDNQSNFGISLDYTGDIIIDWGDGIIEDFTTNGSSLFDDFTHKYEKEGLYFVNISGDIQNITSFYSFYHTGPIHEINLNNLPELIDFSLGFLGDLSNPRIVDFSNNPKLQSINMPNNLYLESIIIPETNEVSSLSIPGPNQISTTTLEQIISRIYESTIQNNRQNGYITLSNQGSGEATLVGPPSETTIDQLQLLKNNYNWQITPDPDLL